jgi:hypothetical protein
MPVWRWRWPWQPPCLAREVFVNLKSAEDEVIHGVLWTTRGYWLVLKECEALKQGQPPERLRGEVLVHRSNVAFLQVRP